MEQRPASSRGAKVPSSPRSKEPTVPATPSSTPPGTASAAADGLSFAQRKALSSRSSSKSSIVEGNHLLRSVDRPLPGDMIYRRKSQVQPALAKKKSAYYENEFAATRESNPAMDRVRNEAIVMAELKTNVIIDDEFSFITDFSYHISNRYQRPMSSIVVNVQHSMCIMFGGSFDPAYTLTIHALPSLVQPTTNKRNAALIQTHIQDTLGVPASRGYVRFEATPEANTAYGGKTVAGEMDDVDRNRKDGAAIDRTPSRAAKSTKKMLGVRSLPGLRPSSAMSMREEAKLPTPPSSMDDTPMIATTIPEHPPTPPKSEQEPEEKPAKVAVRKKSFVSSLFGGRGSTKDRRPKTSGAMV
ncbi:macrophage migration inhibitory factor [Apiospora hydei]|uniref:L-dopachrome isomerase n=1 Tax=Apiospora hydei TaxID=1337664 RepID=A0ABR1V4H8_9PEZI